MELLDQNAIKKQYYKYGGFCGYCGNATPPFAPGLPKNIIKEACEYDGNAHNVKLTEVK